MSLGVNVKVSKIEQPKIVDNGNILYVGGDGPNNYTFIQQAINHANDGDTVFVYSGIYYESIIIYSEIHLIGEDKHSTVIDGIGNYYAILMVDEDIIIENNSALAY